MKITATVQARMGSGRLPGKVLLPICGKPMLQWQVERIRRSRLVDEVIIATSTNPKDDEIANWAQSFGVKVYRGSEDDVLGRIVGLLREHEVELHVELIGDSPCSDPHIIDEVIGYFLKFRDQLDYVSNGTKVTYPPGLEVNVYLAKTLLQIEEGIAQNDPLREHVDIHLNKNTRLRKANLEAPAHYHFPEIYLEVDTKNDFAMVSQVFENFYHKGVNHFSLAQALDFLKARPDLIELNCREHRRWKEFKSQTE